MCSHVDINIVLDLYGHSPYSVYMYVATVPNRNSPPAVLLRESYREQGRVRNRTLANLTHWPAEQVEALRQVLKGSTSVGAKLQDAFQITRSRPHGHMAAVLGTMRRLGLDAVVDAQASTERNLVLAMIAARIIDPGSKLATARALNAETCHSTLGELLQVQTADETDLYAAMDWLLPRQSQIESALARRHLGEGTLVLYDLTSTYFEGHHCPLGKYGYSRDERRSNPQIVFGVISNLEGCPVAVEVFEGNTGDPKTVAAQVKKLRERFQLRHLVLVGDRGMLTQKRIAEDLRPLPGLEWISALRAPQIQKLASDGVVQMSLFDDRELAEVTHPDYAGERLIVCRNPLLADERARKRKELIAAAEKKLDEIVAATRRKRRPVKSAERVHYLVGKALASSKVEKYFRWETSQGFRYERNQERINRDAALDGVYVIRTSVPAERLKAEETVRTYKRLAMVERAFRSLKSVDLKVRPIHHRLPDRVRAHVLICMLAYYVEWHMRQALAPVLFDDEQKEKFNASPVAPAQRSSSAQAKALQKRTPDNLPVQSFQDWLQDLATIVTNRVEPRLKSIRPFDVTTRPTEPQRRALELLQVTL
jgi:transposase